MPTKKSRLFINRLLWMLAFFAGVISFILLEWSDNQGNIIGWFLLTSLWSAVCGIGFSITDWLIHKQKNNAKF